MTTSHYYIERSIHLTCRSWCVCRQ